MVEDVIQIESFNTRMDSTEINIFDVVNFFVIELHSANFVVVSRLAIVEIDAYFIAIDAYIKGLIFLSLPKCEKSMV